MTPPTKTHFIVIKKTLLFIYDNLVYCLCLHVSAAGYEASEGDGAAREKPERAVGETGEVQ